MGGGGLLGGLRKVAEGFIHGAIARGQSVLDTVRELLGGGINYGEDIMQGDVEREAAAQTAANEGAPFDPDLPMPDNFFKERPSSINTRFQYVYRYAYNVEGIAGPVIQYFTIGSDEILDPGDLASDVDKMLQNIETSTSIQVLDVELVEGFHNPNQDEIEIPF